MIKPPIPCDESQRLKTLRDLRLLDTPPEERFDRVTRLARQVFSTPIAVVSLVDADRQWFKSRQGLDAETTARDISFCGHAILDDETMVVNDALNDERFCDNPLVCGNPNIRFYAGYPLAAPDGSRVGTFCIIDNEPKEVTEEQLTLLGELGRMVEEELIAVNESTTDVTTGISNRNGFLAVANYLIPLCRRKDEPTTLMLFHLQDFQTLDGTHGRYEGDTMALELSHLLMSVFRESDIVARISLDVFGVLLPNTGIAGAAVVQRRFEGVLGARNRDSSRERKIRTQAHTVIFDDSRHKNAEKLLQEGEALVFEAQEQQLPEKASNLGRSDATETTNAAVTY